MTIPAHPATPTVDEAAVRLEASLWHRPFLVLVEGAYHDQVSTRAEALRIGAEAAGHGQRVVLLKVQGGQAEWRLIRRWNG